MKTAATLKIDRCNAVVLPTGVNIEILPARPRPGGIPLFLMVYTEAFDSPLVNLEVTLAAFRAMMDQTGFAYSVMEIGGGKIRATVTAPRDAIGAFLVSEFLAWSDPNLMEKLLTAAGVMAPTGFIVRDADALPAQPAQPA